MKSEMAHLARNINDMKSDIAATKSEIAVTKSDMTRLTGKIDNTQLETAAMKSEITRLNSNLTTQMKCFTEAISAQLSVLNASMESRLDKFENRFLFRMLVAVSGPLRKNYILLSKNCEGL
jgi:septal ring factor EnvC (AmiA/AmiB activator)